MAQSREDPGAVGISAHEAFRCANLPDRPAARGAFACAHTSAQDEGLGHGKALNCQSLGASLQGHAALKAPPFELQRASGRRLVSVAFQLLYLPCQRPTLPRDLSEDSFCIRIARLRSQLLTFFSLSRHCWTRAFKLMQYAIAQFCMPGDALILISWPPGTFRPRIPN